MANQIAATAVKPLLGQVIDGATSVASSVTGDILPLPGKPEKPSEPQVKTWGSIFANPCQNKSLMFFLLGGAVGIASLVCYFIKIDILDLPTSVMLFFVGLWATYEIRMIVKFRVQLQHLQRTEEELEVTTTKLTGELDELTANNDNLKKEVDNIDKTVDNIQSENLELGQTVSELEQSVDEFGVKNQSLRETIDKLARQNTQLKEKCVELRKTGDQMQGELNELVEFKENLAKHAEMNSEDLTAIMQQVDHITGQLTRTIHDQESALLSQIASSIEFHDGEETMSEEEYNLFVNRLPQKYKDRLANSPDKSFAFFAGKDKKLDYEEAQRIVEFLLKSDSDEINE